MPAQTFDVVTVTLNPAIDRTVSIPNFTTGGVNRAQDVHSHPAGKGVNVASALADYRVRVAVTGFLGRDNAGSFEALFAQKQIADHFVRIAGQTRVSIKITDPGRQETTDLNFPAPPSAPGDLSGLYEALARLEAGWFVLAGSVPDEVPTDIYREITSILKERGFRVALDGSGEAFRHGLEAAPHLIKPNLRELEEVLGTKLADEAAIVQAARTLVARGIELVIVSLGEKGALYVTAQEALAAVPPPMLAESTVGAGDAMLAGTVAGLQRGLPLMDCARLGTAFAVNALSHLDSGLSPLADIEFLARQVETRSLPMS